MSFEPKLEETITIDFTTANPMTGVAADADSTPTIQVFEDDNDTPIITPTAVKRTAITGGYRIPVACTAANGFESGKSYNVHALASVGGTAGFRTVVGQFQVRSNIVSDVYTLIGATGSGLTSLATATEVAVLTGRLTADRSTKLDFLDAAISSVGGGAAPSATDVATAVWAATQAANNVSGSMGEALNVSMAQPDPWSIDLSSYLTGTAGHRLYTNLDMAISSIDTTGGAGIDSPGVTTLLERLTDPRAANLDNLNATITSRMATFTYIPPPTAQAIWEYTTRTLTSGGGGVGATPQEIWEYATRSLTDKTGFKLASDGLDTIVVEVGVNIRQAMAPILSAAAGVLSGAGTGTITIRAGANPGTTRINAQTDVAGNRSVVTLTLPA